MRSPVPSRPADFRIEGRDGGEVHASNGRVGLTVLADGPTKVRKRNAIKNACSDRAERVQWVYGELDGVRVYVQDLGQSVHIVLSKQDLYP